MARQVSGDASRLGNWIANSSILTMTNEDNGEVEKWATPASKSFWKSSISLFFSSLFAVLALLVYLREHGLEIPHGWLLARSVIPDPPPQAVVGVAYPKSHKLHLCHN